MKYENAKDILPLRLLEEVQRYAGGKKVLYVPKAEKPKGWGEASGYRERLNKRNTHIASYMSKMHLTAQNLVSFESLSYNDGNKEIRLSKIFM